MDKQFDSAHYNEYLKNDGLIGSTSGSVPATPYRVVHLQRLANPLNAFDEVSNPYITVDSCGIDLFVFNGADTFADPNNVPGIMRFGSHERRGTADSEVGQQKERSRLLFKSDLLAQQNPTEDPKLNCRQTDSHILSWNFVHSFGGLNQAYLESETPTDTAEPFCWLTWNNRPFASHLELANVPHGSNYWIARTFDMADNSRNLYAPGKFKDATNPNREAQNYTSKFPHLLNFYADEMDGVEFGSLNNAPSLHRVFDYLEVPSRFIGTESYVNPSSFANEDHDISFGFAAPFDTISNYRYPGKININTVLDTRVWNGLMGGYSVDPHSGVDLAQWHTSRNGNAGSFQFANPYRPAHASNLVPQGTGLHVEPAECGLFRSDGPEPLFDYDADNTDPTLANELAYANDDRAAYFRNAMRQRLGNLVTGRSSVFAVWITIGYFEVSSDGHLKAVDEGGVEAGISDGSVSRPRAFFMFDRSIPVAFEPGKNHNIDRAVLVKSIIE